MILNNSPYAACNRAGVMHTDELVAGGRNVEVGLFFVDEKCVGHPNVFDEL